MAKSNPLNHFAQHNMSIKEFEDMLKRNELVSIEKHKIKVNGGELRILVENGIPKITYLADSGSFFVEMLASNSLRFINVK